MKIHLLQEEMSRTPSGTSTRISRYVILHAERLKSKRQHSFADVLGEGLGANASMEAEKALSSSNLVGAT